MREALAAYRDARDFFSDEFGVEPGERLRNLHVGILRSDPSLALPPAPKPDEAAEPETLDAPPARSHPATPVFAPPDPPLAPHPPSGFPHSPSGPVYEVPPFINPVAGHHLDGGHPVWVPPPAGRRVPWPLRALLMALPVVTLGMVTWALIAYYGARRRSRPLAAMATGYLALAIVFIVGAGSGDPEQSSPWDGPIFFALLATMFGGAVHLAILTADPQPAAHPGGGMPVPNVQLIERRVRREQARALVVHHPSIARRLGIGRPDLPRTFDDGGLVDVNSAPEHVLASLPGMGPYHAKLIVLARTAHGPLAFVDDLTVREILPYQTVSILRDVLIAVPPLPAADPETALPPVEPAPGA